METPDYSLFLKTTPLFSALDENTLSDLSPKLEKITLTAKQILMNIGDSGDSLYLIKQGQLNIFIEDEHGLEILVAFRYPGDSLGEIALLTGEKRSAKVLSDGSSELLCLSKENFAALSLEYPDAFQKITQAMIHQFQQVLVQKLLRASHLFESLNDELLTDLEKELEVSMLKGGHYLVYEGDESDSLHFIISGRLQVVTESDSGAQKVWTELGRGQSVGEMGILTGEKRSASVIALRDALVAKLPQESFYNLLAKHPRSFSQQFSGGIVNRLWGQLQGSDRNINTLATFTVAPANNDVAIDNFCENLAAALAKIGSTLHLNSTQLDSILDRTDAAQTSYDHAYNLSLTQWLSEQETIHQFIIYQTDRLATAWSKRCLRQADRILIVAPALIDPELGEVVYSLKRYCSKVEKTLVLTHEDQTESPSKSKNWLRTTTPDSHFHVRQNQEYDFNRLTRILTGKSISLVLSGGGARGFAHIGAIRALEEFDIQIDQIGGTSMGALLAAQYAMGWDANTMLEKSKDAIKKHYRMEYTLPIVSLLTGKAWGKFLRAFFADIQIEDLWLNYFCCSSNLTDSQLNIHDRGSLWEAVRASSSIPGLIPPLYDRGSILVDGAVLNNMPVDIMQARNNGGLIYAIDVGGGISNSDQHQFEPVQSGWRLIFSRKNKSNIPRMMSILMQSATMGSQMTQQTTSKMADLYIKPKVNDYSILDFEAIELIVEDGYQSAKLQIEQWLKKTHTS